MDWPTQISRMAYVKCKINEADIQNIWPYHLPEVAATKIQLLEVEQCLEKFADPLYFNFLSYANGWKGIYQYVDLFGTVDLIVSPLMSYAKGLLDAIEDSYFDQKNIARNSVLPIATTLIDKDLFVIGAKGTSIEGQVIWLAGEEIDRFPNFEQFFLAMVDYNIEEFNDLNFLNIKPT